MGNDYATYLSNLVPTVLRDADGEQKMRAYGDMQNLLANRTIEGVQESFPEYVADDGVQYIEQDRQIDRALGESTSDFKTRLKEAWDRWAYGGTPRGVLKAFKDQGYSPTNMDLVQSNGVHWAIASGGSDTVTPTLIPAPFSSWIEDGDTAFWSKYTMIFGSMPPSAAWYNAVRGTITATIFVNVVWPTPFADDTYNVATGWESTTNTASITVVNKTAIGCTLLADGVVTGTATAIAWQGDDFPLFSPAPSESAKACRLMHRWKSGKATFMDFLGIVRGHYWGELGFEWGEAATTWGMDNPITVRRYC